MPSNRSALPGLAIAAFLTVCVVAVVSDGDANAQSSTKRQTSPAQDVERLEIASDGWALVGELTRPWESEPRAFALLLHKAAGDRRVYAALAHSLAEAGIASLAMDLRGHGESTTLGRFDPEVGRYYDAEDPAVVRNFALTREGDRDIVAIMRWLEERPALGDLPLVVVGSSYTGQEMVEAAVETRYADVYVALAPGSFAAASIPRIDQSGAPWLILRAEQELPFFPELFAAIRAGSTSAEIRVLPGRGHATDLLKENPGLAQELTDWIVANLPTARR